MTTERGKVISMATYKDLRPLEEIFTIASAVVTAPAEDRNEHLNSLIAVCDELIHFANVRPELAETAIHVAHFCWRTDPDHLDNAVKITKKAVKRTAPQDPVREKAAEILFTKAVIYAQARKPMRAGSLLSFAQVLLPCVGVSGHVLPQDTTTSLSSRDQANIKRALAYYGIDPHRPIDVLHQKVFARRLDRLTPQPYAQVG